MRILGLVAAAVLALSAAAPGAPAPAVDAYRAAASRGETGLMRIRAYTERLKPDAPDVPFRGLVVTLVPFSDALIADLEGIKGHARDSLHAYRTAALQVKRVEEAYERSLWEAGGADLVQSSLVGPDGQHSFQAVAAGHWILWARHEVLNPITPRKTKREDRLMFNLGPKLVGYVSARFWMVPLTVSGGGATMMELTDRNVWFTGVIEETMRQDTAP